MFKKLFLGTAAAVLLSTSVFAQSATTHTETFTWTWPTTRVDGSALALSSIGAFTVYDQNLPVPNLPGTVVPCYSGPIPPTTATGTCTTGQLTSGTHNFVGVVFDNSSTPIAGATSNVVSVAVPLSGPSAVVLSGKLN